MIKRHSPLNNTFPVVIKRHSPLNKCTFPVVSLYTVLKVFFNQVNN